jgi:hypothetical protein
MRTNLVASAFVIGTLLVPLTSYAEDSDKDRSSPGAFVKDSIITTKIKAKLAEEKIASTINIKVDTENKGFVQLSGTAKSQADVDKAGVIARSVEGVVSVENNIRVADMKTGEMRKGDMHSGGMHTAARGDKPSGEERVETRIKELHAKLQITPAQEEQWSKVAQVMRDNEKQMDTLIKTRAERAQMNAIDDLKSYAEITDAHADGMKRFTPVFETLYDTMSEPQKKNADAVFRHGGRKIS